MQVRLTAAHDAAGHTRTGEKWIGHEVGASYLGAEWREGGVAPADRAALPPRATHSNCDFSGGPSVWLK